MNKEEKETVEVYLSFFDVILGPRVLLSHPYETLRNHHAFVSEFFDFHKTGDFFSHIYKEQISFNYLFDITTDELRGRKREFMLSIILPLNLLNKKFNFFIYFSSMQNLFKEYSMKIMEKEEYFIGVDGKRDWKETEGSKKIRKILKLIGEEIDFLLLSIPDTSSPYFKHSSSS